MKRPRAHLWSRHVVCSFALGLASLAAIAACSSFDEDRAGAEDASADATTVPPGEGGVDGADGGSGATCDRAAPFASIARVDGVNSTDTEGYPRLSPDERVIYFQRAKGSSVAIYRAERPSRTSVFGTPVEVAITGGPPNPHHPFPSADELTLTFAARDISLTRFELWSASRPALAVPFGDAHVISPSAPSDHRIEPVISADGRELFFATRPVGSGAYELWRAFTAADGGIFDAGPIVELNSLAVDQGPALSEDGLDLYFYSERGGVSGRGTVWWARRDSRAELFRAPARISELVPDIGYTEPGHVSSDNCRLYFFSNMDPSADADLFVAERPAR